MLGRVKRELATVQPLPYYYKQNIGGQPPINPNRYSQTFGFINGSAVSISMPESADTSNNGAKRRFQMIINEVKERREMRDRIKSDFQGLEGFDIELDQFYDPEYIKTIHYKENVYHFLNSPQGFWSRSYHILVSIVVFACLIVTVFSNIDKFKSGAWKFIYLFEKIIIIWFSIEFLLRLWSSSCKRKYTGWRGKISYVTVPAHILDVIIILASIVIVLPIMDTRNGSEVFAVSAVRGFHRFFSVLQILTLKKQLQPWKVLSSVIYDQREQLFIIFYIEFIVLCILAYISYIVEKDDNPQFNSIAEAMWWALITLTTIGYGDRVPITWLGKLISSLFTVLGVAIFALPAGIIGTGLALKVEEEERNQQRKEKKMAAAILIQSMWRCYKANTNYVAVSSFFKHKPMDLFKRQYYENIANKFVRITKFFIAKRNFRELLRPLDIKNVLQSYKDGQLDVMNKVKVIQNSVDTISKKIGANEQKIFGSNTNLEQKIDRLENSLVHIIDQMNSQMTAIEHISHQLIQNQTFVHMITESKDFNRDINRNFQLFGRKRRKSF